MKEFLGTLVSMKSVSADKEMASESRKTAEFIKKQLEGLGAEVIIIENEVPGKNPLICGKLGNDPAKKTLLYYSHYDVQPAEITDGWNTDPFQLVEKDGYYIGRGTNDDKGPITATYFAIKELLSKGDLPVNIRFLYEGEEESSSGGFEETVANNVEKFGKVDGIMVLDTSWFNVDRPSVDYGFRGVTYMEIEVEGPNADQHSGGFGGVIREPMNDLIKLMASLTDNEGKVLIPGFYDDVTPLTPEEEALYEEIQIDLEALRQHLGVKKLRKEDPKSLLMDNWRNPTLSLHGIEGAFYSPGAKTVIPGKVKGKVSMRTVPDMDPQKIAEIFKSYVLSEFEKLNSPNTLKVRSLGEGDWWYGNVDNFLFKAGSRAIEDYWGMKPSYTRSGGSIPIIPFMEIIFDAPAIGVGVGQPTDGAHSQNEHIRIKNLEGAKEVLKRFMTFVSEEN